ncbi:hypothetical protein ACHAWF_001722 [Thalassiosira exigua]
MPPRFLSALKTLVVPKRVVVPDEPPRLSPALARLDELAARVKDAVPEPIARAVASHVEGKSEAELLFLAAVVLAVTLFVVVLPACEYLLLNDGEEGGGSAREEQEPHDVEKTFLVRGTSRDGTRSCGSSGSSLGTIEESEREDEAEEEESAGEEECPVSEVEIKTAKDGEERDAIEDLCPALVQSLVEEDSDPEGTLQSQPKDDADQALVAVAQSINEIDLFSREESTLDQGHDEFLQYLYSDNSPDQDRQDEAEDVLADAIPKEVITRRPSSAGSHDGHALKKTLSSSSLKKLKGSTKKVRSARW